MGNIQQRPSELIQRERRQLIEGLKNDSGVLLDGLLARGILTVSEYESLDAMDDPERIVRRVLLIVQKKGEFACQELLKCAAEIRPYDSRDPFWNWKLTPPAHDYHHHRSHDSSCGDDGRKVSCGGMCIGVPTSTDKDETDGVEGSQFSEAAELDALEDQESSKDPEPGSQTSENDGSVNEILEEPELDTPENNDLPESDPELEPEPEPEPDYEEVVEDNEEDS
ncbi:nucleolar protein 3 [Antechinus flavipes]|uniref:nucleolar protein 3 n=1 Tax=Antechinus flavipes TaxID=38775 RepID=UPI0022357E83|nr:nucleolar protein 3 [Antechinus flavipes]